MKRRNPNAILNTNPEADAKNKSLIFFAVLLASMGYFVDIYDLLLFSIVRVPSLKSLGFSGQILTDNGMMLLNVQMIGLLLGGICWGILGDKRGGCMFYSAQFLFILSQILQMDLYIL